MEYHSDRFEDFSVLIFKAEKIIALLPANVINGHVHSHQGLTFGGLVLNKKISIVEVLAIFKVLKTFLLSYNIKTLHIKQIPEFYCKSLALESNFVLTKAANLEKREMVLAIDFSKPITLHKTKLKHFEKSKDYYLEIEDNVGFQPFWEQVLKPRLESKFNAKPVHSLKEIIKLNTLFPDNIKQYNIFKDKKLLAGITIFENEQVVKSQYGATTKQGEKYRALDYLFLHLIYKYKAEGKRFFSMGTVAGIDELDINNGLLKQKQELGCQVYLQDFFKLKIYD